MKPYTSYTEEEMRLEAVCMADSNEYLKKNWERTMFCRAIMSAWEWAKDNTPAKPHTFDDELTVSRTVLRKELKRKGMLI